MQISLSLLTASNTTQQIEISHDDADFQTILLGDVARELAAEKCLENLTRLY